MVGSPVYPAIFHCADVKDYGSHGGYRWHTSLRLSPWSTIVRITAWPQPCWRCTCSLVDDFDQNRRTKGPRSCTVIRYQMFNHHQPSGSTIIRCSTLGSLFLFWEANLQSAHIPAWYRGIMSMEAMMANSTMFLRASMGMTVLSTAATAITLVSASWNLGNCDIYVYSSVVWESSWIEQTHWWSLNWVTCLGWDPTFKASLQHITTWGSSIGHGFISKVHADHGLRAGRASIWYSRSIPVFSLWTAETSCHGT